MLSWTEKFDRINKAIESKNFPMALDLIDQNIKDAYSDLIDPRLLIRELKNQRNKVLNLINDNSEVHQTIGTTVQL